MLTAELLIATLLGAVSFTAGPPVGLVEGLTSDVVYSFQCLVVSVAFCLGCSTRSRYPVPINFVSIPVCAFIFVLPISLSYGGFWVASSILSELWIAFILGHLNKELSDDIFGRAILVVGIFLFGTWGFFCFRMVLTFDFPRAT